MKIAVVGSGISGLASAWLVSQKHQVTLYEKNSELGGHAHTAFVKCGEKSVPVDTGFMVFNPPRYPNLIALFSSLGVPYKPTSMRFSVSTHSDGFEFNSDVPFGIFVDKMNFFRRNFWQFLFGILHFNTCGLRALEKGVDAHMTLEEFLEAHKIPDIVRTKYVYPLAGAIWSTPILETKHSPAAAILTFLDHHGLLSVYRPRNFVWQTVIGGSRVYVERVRKDLEARGADIRLNTSITTIERRDDGVRITADGKTDAFDMLVMATHADTALALLSDATPDERDILSKFTYEKNDIILHGDTVCMPHRKRAWAAWNYLGEASGADGLGKVSLTYHMNELQGITETEVFVTLNPSAEIDPKFVYEKFSYEHPIYAPETIAAQARLGILQNKNRTLFCGSYFGYGFHEDGITSAINAVKLLGITPPWL